MLETIAIQTISPQVYPEGYYVHRPFDKAPTFAEASIFAKATTDKSEGKQDRQVPRRSLS